MNTAFRRCLLLASFIMFLSGSFVSRASPKGSKSQGGDIFPAGWSAKAPRDEIRPAFSFEPKGGPTRAGSFVIEHDKRDGLDGWFQKSFAVTGGEFFRFQAVRKLTRVSVPRRSALVRILWQNEAGRMVSADVPEQQVVDIGHVPTMARPIHKAGPPSAASIAPQRRPRGPSLSCTFNGRPRGAWNGATSSLRRPRRPSLARCD
jgi:hypothetical protein